MASQREQEMDLAHCSPVDIVKHDIFQEEAFRGSKCNVLILPEKN